MKTEFEIGDRLYHNSRHEYMVVLDNVVFEGVHDRVSVRCVVEKSEGEVIAASICFLNLAEQQNCPSAQAVRDRMSPAVPETTESTISTISTKWNFPIGDVKAIDWLAIDEELSRDNPVATVAVNNGSEEEHYVIIHDSLVLKAEALELGTPSESIVDFANVFKSKNHFADVIRWAHEVNEYQWNKPTSTVTVQLVKLR